MSDVHIIKVGDKVPRIPVDIFLQTRTESDILLCLSNRDIYLIGLFVGFFRGWRTILGTWVNNRLFRLAGDSEQMQLKEWFEEIDYKLTEENTMSCLDSGLEAIAQAIAGLSFPPANITQSNENNCTGGCGGGCGGSGSRPPSDTPPGVVGDIPIEGGGTIPIYGTQPPLSVPTGEFPEGYTSLEEYQLDKCQVANLVLDGFIGSLLGLGTLGAINYGALAGLIVAALVGLIVFPPALIPVAAVALGFLSIEVTVLGLLANDIQNNREFWVCALYNSDSVESAISVISDGLDAAIARIPINNPWGAAAKTIALLLLNGDTLNQLFSKVAHLTYPDANCSVCEECSVFTAFDLPDTTQSGQAGWVEVNGSYGGYDFGWYEHSSFPSESITEWTREFSEGLSSGNGKIVCYWSHGSPGATLSAWAEVVYIDDTYEIAGPSGFRNEPLVLTANKRVKRINAGFQSGTSALSGAIMRVYFILCDPEEEEV